MSDTPTRETPEQVIGELTNGEGGSSPRRLPVSPGVRGVDVPGPGELVDLPREIVAVLTVPVKEDQWVSLTFLYEMMFDIHALQR